MSIDEGVAEVELVEVARTVDGFGVAVPGPEAAAPSAPAEPVAARDRVGSVDLIRGIAVLGILAMNMVSFAWPDDVYSVPIRDPDAGPLDVALWAFNHAVFNTKMMSLFSMLFGAGLVLMSDRAEGRGARLAWVYYRRVAWLLVIGLAHAYLVWDGDILVEYAACGVLLYPCRRLGPRTLIAIGLYLNLLLVPLFLGFRECVVPFMRETAARVEAGTKAGRPPEDWEQAVRERWEEMIDPGKREDFLREIDLHRGSYAAQVKHRAGELIWFHLFGIPFVMIGLSGGRMLIGMGLMKLGVFSAACSRRAYLAMLLVGYGVGLPLMAFDIHRQVGHGFYLDRRFEAFLEGGFFLTILGSLPVVFGHIGAVMLWAQSGALPWLRRRLEAVGRMALSHYLLDSILFTAVFNGYGLDLYAAIHRPLLAVFVLLTWAFQLWVSQPWLERFRYGPAEWAWRSLTYGKVQPMLRSRPTT
jgi:uncharacterized protein